MTLACTPLAPRGLLGGLRNVHKRDGPVVSRHRNGGAAADRVRQRRP